MGPRSVSLALAVVVGVFGVACQPTDPQSTDPLYCDDVTAEMGGCDPDQPTFEGTDCRDLGRQFGIQVNDSTLAIVTRPEPEDRSYATAAHDRLTLTAIRLSQHRHRVDVSCTTEEVFEAATAQFSEEFWEKAPKAVWDGPVQPGPPVDLGRDGYEEFLFEMLDFILQPEPLESEVGADPSD